MRTRGLSLVELLVSVAIGMALIGLAVHALMTVRRTAVRVQAVVLLHDEAAVIHREVGEALQSTHPGCQWRLDADPGADGIWGAAADGSCDDRVSLTWLATVAEKEARTFTFGRDWACDQAWARLTWEGGGAGGQPRLLFARSNGYRSVTTPSASGSTATIRIYPQTRRDRRRDLDDDDLRYVAGVDPTLYATLGAQGDGADLDAQLAPLHGPHTRVAACAIAWVDRGGHQIGWDSRSGHGISASDASGAGEAVPGGDDHHAALDGLWLDGRDATAAGATRPIDRERPVLVRLSVVLADDPSPANPALRADAASAGFDFSFPVDPVLGGWP